MIDSICIQVYIILYYFCSFCVKKLSTHLSTFEAENSLFHKHAEAQLKKVRAYKKKIISVQCTRFPHGLKVSIAIVLLLYLWF